jgi:hypothetical protein
MKKHESLSHSYQIDLHKIKGLFMQANNHEREGQVLQVLKALKDRFNKKT